jgi:hypothetical protein
LIHDCASRGHIFLICVCGDQDKGGAGVDDPSGRRKDFFCSVQDTLVDAPIFVGGGSVG